MPGSIQPSLTCQKGLRIEQARKPHHYWQLKVLCPDLKFSVSHEKIVTLNEKQQ